MATKKTHNKAAKKKTTIGKSPLTKRKQPVRTAETRAIRRSIEVKVRLRTNPQLFKLGVFFYEQEI